MNNIGKLNGTPKNILATVAYYDAFSYPLTAFEVWKYLIRSDYAMEVEIRTIDFHSILHELKQDPITKFVEEYNGLYFLRGRKKIVFERIRKSKISSAKLRRFRTVANFFKFVPFVRMIAITGRLAMKNARPESDWDLLVVLKKGKIWTGRTLVTSLAQIIGKRRHGIKIKDRICLNYFISENSLEISTKDLYSANEYFFIQPLFGFEVFKKFQLKNRWISQIKPNYMPSEIEPIGLIKDSFFSKNIRLAGEFVFGWSFLEDMLRTLEKRKIMKNPKTYQEGGLVQASDEALIFLPQLKGPRIFEKFKKNIESLA